MSEIKHKGACLCGQVSIALSAEPVAIAICHCTHCQKQTGSAFSTVVLVPAAAAQITGTLKEYADRSDAGTPVSRFFCGVCGSPVHTTSAGTRAQGIAVIKAGLLDDASTLRPGLQIFCDSAQEWVPDLPNAARFAKMPNG